MPQRSEQLEFCECGASRAGRWFFQQINSLKSVSVSLAGLAVKAGGIGIMILSNLRKSKQFARGVAEREYRYPQPPGRGRAFFGVCAPPETDFLRLAGRSPSRLEW